MKTKPRVSKEKLRRLYHYQGLSQREVAERVDCTPKTLRRWFDEYGIESRGEGRDVQYKQLQDKEWLYKQFYQKDRSTKEIADELGTYSGRVSQWLKKHDMSPTEHPYIGYNDGYLEIHTSFERENLYAQVHRLCAVAWFGYDEVVGKEVHHKNGIPWDNREENLEPLTQSEHMSLHAKERHEQDKF